MKASRALSWMLQILVALVLAPMAFAKFAGDAQSVEIFSQLGMEPTGRYIIGVLELLAAAMLLMPNGVAWGAILGWGVMSGAIIAHATVLGVGDPIPRIGLPLGVMAIFNWLGCSVVVVLHRNDIEFIRNMSPKKKDTSPERP